MTPIAGVGPEAPVETKANGLHHGAAASCARCERVRPIHGYGFCMPCYLTLYRRGHLPVRLPRGRTPCQDCGQRPQDLRYRHPSHRGLTHGRCYGCAARWRRARAAAA